MAQKAMRESTELRQRQTTEAARAQVTPINPVAARVAGLSAAQLACRAWGHWWPEVTSSNTKYGAAPGRVGVTRVEEHCERGCGVWRDYFGSMKHGTFVLEDKRPQIHYEDSPGYLMSEKDGWDYQGRLWWREQAIAASGVATHG